MPQSTNNKKGFSLFPKLSNRGFTESREKGFSLFPKLSSSGFTESREKGFTLVETIVVAVIIAILAGAGIPFFMGYLNDARIDTAHSTCELIGTAVIQTHNRGLNITESDWGDIGISNPSDELWTYQFGGIGGADIMVAAYTITATGVGKMSGKIGTFKPKETGTARWSVQ